MSRLPAPGTLLGYSILDGRVGEGRRGRGASDARRRRARDHVGRRRRRREPGGVPRRFPAVARRRFYWPSPSGRPLNVDPWVWADSKASARGDRLRGRCPKISFWALRSPAARFFAPGQRGTARGSDQERVLTRRVGLPVQSISLMQGGCVRKPVLSAVLTHNPTFFMRCMGGRSANERPQDV